VIEREIGLRTLHREPVFPADAHPFHDLLATIFRSQPPPARGRGLIGQKTHRTAAFSFPALSMTRALDFNSAKPGQSRAGQTPVDRRDPCYRPSHRFPEENRPAIKSWPWAVGGTNLTGPNCGEATAEESRIGRAPAR